MVVLTFGFIMSLISIALVVPLTFVSILISLIVFADIEVNQNLQAINDDTSQHGSFFIGSGTIDEEPSYFFYQQLDKQ